MANKKSRKKIIKRKTSNPRRKKKIIRKKKVIEVRPKNPERELAKALSDLNKIFGRKKLAKQFRIKIWQVSAYKNYRKRKLFDKKKRLKIMSFYKKLQEPRHGEDFQYNYKIVSKKKRLVPNIGLQTAENK